MTFKVEPMDFHSLNDVLEISKLSFPIPWSKNSLLNELKNPLAHYLVAKYDNEVVGFIGLWLVLDEGNITNLAVHPQHRGKKISDLLMKNIINLCKNNNGTSIMLEVRASNLVAQNLYKKHGFIEEGIRKKYYEDNGEDAIIMWKYNI